METTAAQRAVSDLWWVTPNAVKFAQHQWQIEQQGSVYWREFELGVIGEAILSLTEPALCNSGWWLPSNSEFAQLMKEHLAPSGPI